MSLHGDLPEQAEHLAKIDMRRPKQANLRRAISASYYALFHLLTSEASALYVADFGLAARINRTYNHGEMKKASAMIANDKFPGSSPKRVGTILPRGAQRPLFSRGKSSFRTVRNRVSPSRIAGRTRVVAAVQDIQDQQQHRSSQIHGVSQPPNIDRPAETSTVMSRNRKNYPLALEKSQFQ